MANQRVSVVRTPITMRVFADALLRAWKHVEPLVPTKHAAAVLWGHVMIETGGKALWNHNLGNVKWWAGSGLDFCCLEGTWEGLTRGAFEQMKSDRTWGHLVELDNPAFHVGRRKADGTVVTEEEAIAIVAQHNKAVAPKISVVFSPPHPVTRFCAYASLADGMVRHLKFLKGADAAPGKRPWRYRAAWEAAVTGDFKAFAKLLHEGDPAVVGDGYFTASPEAYAKGMSNHVLAYVASTVHDGALAEYLAALDAPTQPDPVDDPTLFVDEDLLDARRDATTDAIVDLARQRINDRNDGD